MLVLVIQFVPPSPSSLPTRVHGISPITSKPEAAYVVPESVAEVALVKEGDWWSEEETTHPTPTLRDVPPVSKPIVPAESTLVQYDDTRNGTPGRLESLLTTLTDSEFRILCIHKFITFPSLHGPTLSESHLSYQSEVWRRLETVLSGPLSSALLPKGIEVRVADGPHGTRHAMSILLMSEFSQSSCPGLELQKHPPTSPAEARTP